LARLGDLSADPAALEQAALEGKALLQGEKRCGRSGTLGHARVLTSSRRQRKAGAGGPIIQATCSRGAPPLGAKQGQELAAWQEHWAAWPLGT